MKAQLKNINCSDIDLFNYTPEEPDNFGFNLEALIGAENEQFSEIFQILVCTPKWLISNHSQDDVFFGFRTLIVFEYDIERITNYLYQFCETCVGDDWQEIVKQLCYMGDWEFDNYQS